MSGLSTTTPEGHRLLSIYGQTYRIDAQPPEGHQPATPAATGMALAPCTGCGKPLAALFAAAGHHLLCEPRPLRICGAGRVWSALHVITTDTVVIRLREIPGRRNHCIIGQPATPSGARTHASAA